MDVHAPDFKSLQVYSWVGQQDNYEHKVHEIRKIAASTVTVLVGSTGMGKTTFLLGYQEPEFHKSDMPRLYLDLSNSKYCNSLENLQTFFDVNKHTLFLLDSFDVFVSTSEIHLPTLFSFIKTSVLDRSGSLMIATRLSGVNILYHYLDKIHHHYVIDGFTDEGRNEYFESVCAPDDMKRIFKERVLLGDLCKIPLVSEQLLSSMVLKKFNLRDATLTDAVYEIVLGLVSKELSRCSGKRVSLSSFQSLSGEYALCFKVISKLALAEMITGKFDSLKSASLFLSSFFLRESISSLKIINTLGLVDFCEYVPHFSDVMDTLFWFLSPHIRDFLSSYCLHDLPPLDQLYFLSAHAQGLIDRGYHGWLHYFYGLTMQSKAKYSPTRMMMGCINELLLQCLDLEKSSHILTFLGCLVEAKETSHWRRLGVRHGKIFNIKLSLDEFEQARNGLSAMVSQAGIKEWVVEASAKHENVAAVLMNEMKSRVSIEFTANNNIGDEIRLRPKLVPSAVFEKKLFAKVKISGNTAEKKQEKLNLFCCKAVREILQRVLQLFSKLKLKGDSSNPSYLSFLSCDCLRIAMEECVQFEPVIPVHTLSVQGATKMKMVEMDMTALHVSEVHEGKALELVVLLQPTLRRMKFVLPNGKEEFEIRFSSEPLPETVYVDYLSSILEGWEQVVQCIASQELTPRKCERVYPCMPVPVNHTELMGGKVVLPSHFTHPKMSYQSQGSAAGGGGSGEANGLSKLHALNPPLSITHHSMHDKKSLFSQGTFHTIGIQQSSGRPRSSRVESVQQSSRPASAMKPGTLIYTTVPELLSTDKIYPLPDESSQIQIGGNGLIFRGKINGFPVAIKKTAYRSKEYAIMVKVRHSNILQLLGFMWGEENPLQRRRYFCYHIMPQMTGKTSGSNIMKL